MGSSGDTDALERALWLDSPLYTLMCRVVNGELSDWPTGAGEPSHVRMMTGSDAPWERETREEPPMS